MKKFIPLIRKGHLYLGLFLFPWAILYGFTGFLFNHPAVLNGNNGGQPFGPELFQGTPLDTSPNPDLIASQVVDQLNERNGSMPQYTLEGPATISGKRMEASVTTEKGNVLLAMDVHHKIGTIRPARMAPPRRDSSTRAPFAVGSSTPGGRTGRNEGGNGSEKSGKQGPRGSEEKGKSAGEGILIPDGFANRARKTIPGILETLGYTAPGEITITSAPNIVFPIKDAEKTWMVTYHGANGAVSGEPAAKTAPAENEGLSWRNFLTRLHRTHGYPADAGPATFFALLVDLMAGTMCFWGISGVVMWWQLKAVRKSGLVVLFLSLLSTIPLMVFMYSHLAGTFK